MKAVFYEMGNTYDPNNVYHIYGRKSFNKYGDAYMHWKLAPEQFPDEGTDPSPIMPEVMPYLVQFKNYVAEKKATLVVLPCVYKGASYDNNVTLINNVAAELKKNGFPLIAEPIRYRFADKYFYNTPYHLTKEGADLRTDMVIQDMSKVIPPK